MAATWDDLNAKYGSAKGEPASGGGDAWATLGQKYSAPAASAPTKETAKEAKEVGFLDRVRAGAAGINKGFFSDLVGLPVDTAANVVDLAKAGFGTVATMAGRPDLAPSVSRDRSDVVGSSDWFSKRINEAAGAVGMQSPIDNPNPQDRISRVVHSGGRVAGASVVPNPKASIGPITQAVNAGMGAAGGLTGGLVAEVAPDYAGVASMLPGAAVQAGGAAIKRSVRGGEAGRRDMEQRVQDFKLGGVDNPSAGLASGNKLLQGVENLLALTPGSSGIMEKSRQGMIGGMQAKNNLLAQMLSPVQGAVEAGTGIQADLKGVFKGRIGDTYAALNNRVEQAVGPTMVVPVDNALARAIGLTTPIKGAEATSSQFINPRIAQIAENLRTDVYGPRQQPAGQAGMPNPTLNAAVEPPSPMPANPTLWNLSTPGQGYVSNPGLWNAPATPVSPMPARPTKGPIDPNGNAALWNAQKEPGIPFSALKNLRTRVGQETQSNAIMGTPEQGEFKQLYGALSQDMKNGVSMADLLNGTKGSQALARANEYYANAMTRADALNPLANRSTPEGAFRSVEQSLKSGPSTYDRVRNAVSPETRQKIVATIVGDMGKATPGQQNAEGSEWSARTFITNYNSIDPAARQSLFKRIPGGAEYAKNLEEIARAADMVNQGAKVWSNPSGTGAALSNRATVGALTVGAFLQPLYAAGVAGGLLAGHGASRLLTSPDFVKWLASAPKASPEAAQSHVQRLIEGAKLSGDKQYQQDVMEYVADLTQ